MKEREVRETRTVVPRRRGRTLCSVRVRVQFSVLFLMGFYELKVVGVGEVDRFGRSKSTVQEVLKRTGGREGTIRHRDETRGYCVEV